MKKTDDIWITKASGEPAVFSEEKLRRSLERSGARPDEVQHVVSTVREKLYKGITTKKIYQLAFNLLKETSGHLAARYHLKRGIMQLGPSGYPFEKYVGEILRHQGYKVSIGQIVPGRCVKHEIDVIAIADHSHYMIECKYHNQPGIMCDVKIPLYIQARFKDVEAEWLKLPGHDKLFHQGWVVTNTRFSSDAIQYGNCAGLHLMGWDYPQKGSLKSIVDSLGLYPLTCLTTLTLAEKQLLLDRKIVLCKELCNNTQYLSQVGVSATRIKKILDEGYQLCRHLTQNGKN